MPDHPTQKLKLLVFDVDGVLTDGGIYYDNDGKESKRFHVRDGFAFKRAMEQGLHVGVITGRQSNVVTHRMNELGVQLLIQNCKDKRQGLETLCQQAGVQPSEASFLGDDLIDLPAMHICGYPMAVADAVEETRAAATYITQTPGGHGAAREAIEHILKSRGDWPNVMARFNP